MMVRRYDLSVGEVLGQWTAAIVIDDCGDYVHCCDYAALEARVAELEMDAARYRWLRDDADLDVAIDALQYGSDKNIDEAIRGSK